VDALDREVNRQKEEVQRLDRVTRMLIDRVDEVESRKLKPVTPPLVKQPVTPHHGFREYCSSCSPTPLRPSAPPSRPLAYRPPLRPVKPRVVPREDSILDTFLDGIKEFLKKGGLLLIGLAAVGGIVLALIAIAPQVVMGILVALIFFGILMGAMKEAEQKRKLRERVKKLREELDELENELNT